MEQRAGDAENSLEKIKRQLASGSGRNLLQGPLLKRSETVRSSFSVYPNLIGCWWFDFCWIQGCVLLSILVAWEIVVSRSFILLVNSELLFVNRYKLTWEWFYAAEEMERAVGNLGPDDWENGVQVSICFAFVFFFFFFPEFALLCRKSLIFDICWNLFALGFGEMSQLSREPLYLTQIAPFPYLLSTSSEIDFFLNKLTLLNSQLLVGFSL